MLTGTPCSFAVGTSGAVASRLSLVTASIFTRPLATCGCATESGTTNACTAPDACPAPRRDAGARGCRALEWHVHEVCPRDLLDQLESDVAGAAVAPRAE